MNLYAFNASKGPKFHRVAAICALLSLGAADPVPSGPALSRGLAKLASGPFGVQADPTLSKIARQHAQEVLVDFRSAHRSRVKAALQHEGLADAQVAPFAAVGPDPSELVTRAQTFARTQARPRGPTHLGVALRQGEGQWALVAIFSRRTVALPPLPRALPPKGLTVRGACRTTAGLSAYLLGPITRRDEGRIESLPILAQRGPRSFGLSLPAPAARGRYVLQVVESGPRGPEVAAQWTFTQGHPKGAWPPAPPRTAGQDAEASLELLNRLRDKAELAPVHPHAGLQHAAQAHAQAMCAAQVTAHQLPGGAAPDQRVRAEGYTGRVLENVARAASVGQAHQNLALSPSHRLNMLDPTIEDVGVGVVTAPSAEGLGTSRCVVQLFGAQR